MGIDAVDSEHDEWSGEDGAGSPAAGPAGPEQKPPCEDRRGTRLEGGEGEMWVVNAAEELDHGRMEKERERGVREGEVVVGNLTEGEAPGRVEKEAEVPEDGDAGVLPEREGSGRERERGGADTIAGAPPRSFGHAEL